MIDERVESPIIYGAQIVEGFDYYILQAIAGQHDRGGLETSLIREAIDYRLKLVLTDV